MLLRFFLDNILTRKVVICIIGYDKKSCQKEYETCHCDSFCCQCVI